MKTRNISLFHKDSEDFDSESEIEKDEPPISQTGSSNGDATAIIPAVPSETDGVWRLLEIAPGGTLVLLPDENPATADKVALHKEKTPASFFHLFAELERRATGVPIVGVTSAVVGEGKTTIALHLARAAAHYSFRSVCLIDLSMGEDELRRRVVATPSPAGIVGFLESGEPISYLRWPGVGDLSLIPAGKAPSNPAKTARSPRIGDLLEGLRDTFDLVIVDLPALSTDNAAPLLQHIPSVVLVMRAGATPRGIAVDAVEKIGRENVIGVVLNRVESRRGSAK